MGGSDNGHRLKLESQPLRRGRAFTAALRLTREEPRSLQSEPPVQGFTQSHHYTFAALFWAITKLVFQDHGPRCKDDSRLFEKLEPGVIFALIDEEITVGMITGGVGDSLSCAEGM